MTRVVSCTCDATAFVGGRHQFHRDDCLVNANNDEVHDLSKWLGAAERLWHVQCTSCKADVNSETRRQVLTLPTLFASSDCQAARM